MCRSLTQVTSQSPHPKQQAFAITSLPLTGSRGHGDRPVLSSWGSLVASVSSRKEHFLLWPFSHVCSGRLCKPEGHSPHRHSLLPSQDSKSLHLTAAHFYPHESSASSGDAPWFNLPEASYTIATGV